MRPDQRSPEAAAYRKLYNTARWKALRKAQLQAQPLCERCKAKGFIVSATVANHVVPHRGDETAFFAGKLSSLCKACHDGPVQSEEKTGRTNDQLGYSARPGLDGWPSDRRHPANRIR
jgi:5-methylcytosine-specific restriction protein A